MDKKPFLNLPTSLEKQNLQLADKIANVLLPLNRNEEEEKVKVEPLNIPKGQLKSLARFVRMVATELNLEESQVFRKTEFCARMREFNSSVEYEQSVLSYFHLPRYAISSAYLRVRLIVANDLDPRKQGIAVDEDVSLDSIMMSSSLSSLFLAVVKSEWELRRIYNGTRWISAAVLKEQQVQRKNEIILFRKMFESDRVTLDSYSSTIPPYEPIDSKAGPVVIRRPIDLFVEMVEQACGNSFELKEFNEDDESTWPPVLLRCLGLFSMANRNGTLSYKELLLQHILHYKRPQWPCWMAEWCAVSNGLTKHVNQSTAAKVLLMTHLKTLNDYYGRQAMLYWQ